MSLRSLVAVAALPFVVFTHPRPAEACGGCFPPPPQNQDRGPTVVTGHRMALSISTERTVLWDQIQYSGDPDDFAWVLPVGPGAIIEASSDAWFESLDAVTSTHVSSGPLFCAGSGSGNGFSDGDGSSGCSGFACGASDAEGDGGGDYAPDTRVDPDPDDGVDVLHEGTVGPYETVTLHADDGDSLQTWLTEHGYDLPAEIEPIVAAYVAEGSDFIALRLAPGAGVRQMTPVRVVTPGASTILPLRMVAAGTGANVSIVLYVIGEGRYESQSHPLADVDPAELRWDWAAKKSNWNELREDALAEGGFLSTYARRGALRATQVTSSGSLATYADANGFAHEDLASLYFGQSTANANEAEDCSSAVDMLAGSGRVEAPCPDGPGTCPLPDEAISADNLVCGVADDLAAALIGMHPSSVWVTRLEANLPRQALAEDLRLQANIEGEMENWITAAAIDNAPCTQVPASQAMLAGDVGPIAGGDASVANAGACGIRPLRTRAHTTAASVALLALALIIRRSSRKQRSRG